MLALFQEPRGFQKFPCADTSGSASVVFLFWFGLFLDGGKGD